MKTPSSINLPASQGAVVVVIFLFCFCRVAPAQELLDNGNFEAGGSDGQGLPPVSWTPDHSTTADALKTSTAARGTGYGLWSYTGSVPEDTLSRPYQDHPATPGTVYHGSAWIRTPPGETWVTGSKALIQVLLIRSGGVDIYESTYLTAANTNWVPYQV